MRKIKPVIRLVGSKYKKVDIIIKYLDLKFINSFIDLFGGTGIIGVNVKLKIGCQVIINDYDNILPITENYAIKNQCSFSGNNIRFTKSAVTRFAKKIQKDYWPRLEEYNKILGQCSILHKNYRDFHMNANYVAYIDPPYYNKKLYDYSIDHQELKDYIDNLKEIGARFLLSYNDCEFIRNLYKDYYIREEAFNYSSGGKTQNNKCSQTK